MADLTTIQAVKRALLLGGPDGSAATDHDAFLTDLIPRATGFCQKHTGRSLVNVPSLVRVYDGTGTDALDLRELPVNSIATVHEDTERAFGADTLLTAGTDYYLDSASGILYRAGGLPWVEWDQAVRVAMNVGYTSVPALLEQAAVLLVSLWYGARAQAGVESRTTDGDTVTRRSPDDVMKEVRKLLSGFTNHGMTS